MHSPSDFSLQDSPPITIDRVSGFLRLPAILQIIPVSKSSLWEMVRRGDFPAPVKLSARITAWRSDDVRAFIERHGVREG